MLKFMKQNRVLIFLITIIIIVSSIIGFILYFSNDTSLKTLYVENPPVKTIYFIGESFDLEGIRISAIMNNGEKIEINTDSCVISGFDNSVACEQQKITITYEDKECYLYIVVKKQPEFPALLTGISIKVLPNKLVYNLGESIDVTGGVIECMYSDGTSRTIPLDYNQIYGFKNNEIGNLDIIVKYTENGMQVQTSFQISFVE